MGLTEIPQPHSSQSEDAPHIVHFYSDDKVLVREVTRIMSAALNRGEPAIAIATRSHCDEVVQELKREVRNFPRATAEGWCVMLNAAETLSRFMVNGMPHPERFADVLTPVIVRASLASPNPQNRITVFGEMVSLLCAQGNAEAAVRLEQLWNKLAQTHSLSVYCAYTAQYAKKHRDLIVQFGRFPHRNRVLGRDSTDKEQEWLASGKNTFGQ